MNESCYWFIYLQGRVSNDPKKAWAIEESDLMAMTLKLN